MNVTEIGFPYKYVAQSESPGCSNLILKCFRVTRNMKNKTKIKSNEMEEHEQPIWVDAPIS